MFINDRFIDRLESSEQREMAALCIMHNVVERAERSEKRITDLTGILADLLAKFETPLENTVQSLYGPRPYAGDATQRSPTPEPRRQAEEETKAHLKLDFDALNKHAIENSQRVQRDLDAAPEKLADGRESRFGTRRHDSGDSSAAVAA
jgi:hypothetical protein